MADLMHPYRRPYRADTATVEVKFLTPETAVETRSKTCWHGFSAEHVHITKQKQYSYEWCGATHYLALHDLQLKDGELQVAGQTHRPTDLRQKMSFIPRDCSATGWAEPEKRGNSFMAIYFDPEVMSKDLDSLYFPIELMPMPQTVKPGQTVKDSGIYRGSKSGEQTTLVRGKTAPPTPQRGERWREVVDTNPRDKSSR